MALKYYASVRLEVRIKEKLAGEGGQVGIRVKAKCVKSAASPPRTLAFLLLPLLLPLLFYPNPELFYLTPTPTDRRCVKNKVAPPYKLAEFDIMFGSGISSIGCLLDAAEAVGAVQKRGSWYYAGEARLGQGRDKALEAVKADEALRARVERETRAALAGVDLNDLYAEDAAAAAAAGASEDEEGGGAAAAGGV
jgi:hypothetical protein